MNGKQIAMLIGGIALAAWVVWYDLPIEFPGTIVKVIILFLKLSAILALTIAACILAGRDKKPS